MDKMNRRALPLLLALLTVFIVGRIGISWVKHSESMLAVSTPAAEVMQAKVPLPDSAEQVKVVAQKKSAKKAAVQSLSVLSWKGALIPSAKAAANMNLSEEANARPVNEQDLESLRAAREEANKREKALKERQDAAKEAEAKAVKRIAELQELEARIQDLLDQEKSINDKKIKRLTTVYEGMKAAKAAPVIAQMKLKTVVKMFSRMNEKQVGKILSFLPPKQAVIISQALTKRIGSLPR